MDPFRLVINGKKIPTKKCFEVLDPASEKVAGLAPLARTKDLDAAVSAADRAFVKWRDVPEARRQAACMKIAAKIEKNAEGLAQLLTSEQGKPLNGLGSRWEIGGAVAWTRYTASLSLPVKVLQDNNEGKVELHRKPIGVVGSITPWNFPVLIAIWHIIPAVLSGNTVVCKPSPFTPLSTLRLVELMNEVLPKGVVNCVAGKDRLGAAMASHDGIGKIVFTGSCATGQKIMANAAETMKRLTLELGGNDAGIVLADVDPREIAEGLFWGAFINGGQTCAALKRLYVHEDVYDDVCDELVAFARKMKVGKGTAEDVVIGPVQNERQYDVVADLVQSARRNGPRAPRRQARPSFARRWAARAISTRRRSSPTSTTATAWSTRSSSAPRCRSSATAASRRRSRRRTTTPTALAARSGAAMSTRRGRSPAAWNAARSGSTSTG